MTAPSLLRPDSPEVLRAREHAVFPKTRRIAASDGTRIAYGVVGDGDGIPIVFVNGWTCSDAYWITIGPKVVEAGHPAVFIDTRGHGESGLPRAPGIAASLLRNKDVAPARLALDALEVLDDAGIERAVFAGHSMGVQTIIECYRQAPDRVAALIPVAGTYENPVKTFFNVPWFDRLYPAANVMFRVLPFEVFRPYIRRTANGETGLKAVQALKIGGPKVTEELIAPHMAQIGDVNFSVLFRMMTELRRHRTRELLPKIDVPVLVLAGRLDLFTPPAVQQVMADAIPGAEIVWFEEAGHMLPIEEPEACAAALVDFVRRRVRWRPDQAAAAAPPSPHAS
jgi:pimeloyl-ACP methyl ester carboxylesterase